MSFTLSISSSNQILQVCKKHCPPVASLTLDNCCGLIFLGSVSLHSNSRWNFHGCPAVGNKERNVKKNAFPFLPFLLNVTKKKSSLEQSYCISDRSSLQFLFP